MLTYKGVVKLVFAAVAICAVVIGAIILILSSMPVENPILQEQTREKAIPEAAVKATPSSDFYPPVLRCDEWSQPVPLEQAINTAGGEDSAFVMPNGNTLYFFFTPNVTVPAEKQLFDGVTGIYVSRKQEGSWGKAERIVLQVPGKLALDGAEFVQGNTMWFASAREGYAGVNLFTAEFKDGKWMNWQYVGDKLMKEYQVGEMHITADGNEMYFHSDRIGTKGGLDIWVTKKEEGGGEKPENVAEVK